MPQLWSIAHLGSLENKALPKNRVFHRGRIFSVLQVWSPPSHKEMVWAHEGLQAKGLETHEPPVPAPALWRG